MVKVVILVSHSHAAHATDGRLHLLFFNTDLICKTSWKNVALPWKTNRSHSSKKRKGFGRSVSFQSSESAGLRNWPRVFSGTSYQQTLNKEKCKAIYYKSLTWILWPFWGDSLLNHHLGWPTGGKSRYKLPRKIPKMFTQLAWTDDLFGSARNQCDAPTDDEVPSKFVQHAAQGWTNHCLTHPGWRNFVL